MEAGQFSSSKGISVGFSLFHSEPSLPLLVQMTKVTEESCKVCSSVIQVSACPLRLDYTAIISKKKKTVHYKKNSATLKEKRLTQEHEQQIELQDVGEAKGGAEGFRQREA